MFRFTAKQELIIGTISVLVVFALQTWWNYYRRQQWVKAHLKQRSSIMIGPNPPGERTAEESRH